MDTVRALASLFAPLALLSAAGAVPREPAKRRAAAGAPRAKAPVLRFSPAVPGLPAAPGGVDSYLVVPGPEDSFAQPAPDPEPGLLSRYPMIVEHRDASRYPIHVARPEPGRYFILILPPQGVPTLTAPEALPAPDARLRPARAPRLVAPPKGG